MSVKEGDEIFTRAQDCFREVFDQPALALRREMKALDVQGWDSLSHVRLIGALESLFKIRFTTQEIMSAGDVGVLLDLIQKKGAR